jgi:acyl-CoA synthetase (AMP-forming)/AMP-acid ligase II/thioesterase domain-containing protein/acyl carrier protein
MSERTVPGPALQGLLEEVARREPERVALREALDTLTFAQLWRRSGRVAALLIERGVRAGDVVAVPMPRSIDMVVALFAGLRAGAACLPLDLRVPPARNRRLMEAARARWSLIRGTEPPECVDPERAIRLDGPLPDGPAPNPAIEGRRDALLVFTSGSTGEPKGVRLSHAALIARSRIEIAAYELGPQDAYFLRTSPAFVGLAVGLAMLAGGVTLAVAGDEAGDNVEALLKLMPALGVTFAPFSPRLIEALLATPGCAAGLAGLRVLRSAGEALSPELARRFHAALPSCRLVDGYGTTETSGVVVSADVAGPRASEEEKEGGAPLFGVEVRLAGPDGRPGRDGEIWVSTPMLATSYLGGESAEDPRFIDEGVESEGPPLRWYRTGDAGRLTPRGRIRVLGRMDLQLNIDGVRAEPGEIENALRLHGSVADAAVWMHPDASGRSRLVAYLVDRGEPAPAAALRAFLSALLPPPLIPARFLRVRDLPLTPSGKVDRAGLPRPESVERVAVRPRGEDEAKILALFAEVLEAPDLGVTDDFFEWGGDSLKAVALMSRVFEVTGIRLPAAVILNAPTAETLARQVARGDPGQVMAVWLRRTGDLPPLVCLPGLAADPLWMLPLMSALDPRQPLLGLSFVGLKPPIDLLNASSLGVAELRENQPRGPYFLLGHSLGGVLAFEMARELVRQGDDVAFVGLLDTRVPGAPRPPVSRPTVPGPGLRGRTSAALRVGKARLREFLIAAGLWPRPAVPFLRGFRQALERHRIEPCDLSVTLFRARDEAAGVDTAAAWTGLALGGVEVIDIPGHHFNMLGGAHAEALGALIASAVERARATSSSRGSSSRSR